MQGIFFDEQASGTEQLEQLSSLYEHVRKTHNLALVVTNPGTVCDEKYLTRPASDVVTRPLEPPPLLHDSRPGPHEILCGSPPRRIRGPGGHLLRCCQR
ncbi:MAG: spherulation-specific family 4 protein [Planctomycetales bacterium]|nr:spherulation-specific family 4 protein [Planctomycetales bacterium]